MSSCLQFLSLKLEVRQQVPVPIGHEQWFQRIMSLNRGLLEQPTSADLGKLSAKDILEVGSWKFALSALGTECAHRYYKETRDLQALMSFLNRTIDEHGSWITPLGSASSAMKGYSLLYVASLTGEARFERAAELLTQSLVKSSILAKGGPIPYEAGGDAILVDSLAMICPFLARYSDIYDDEEALRICVDQLTDFVTHCVDILTRLPYHGYYSGGPTRLGLHGWGRGTGWYMLGIIDSLEHMPNEHPQYGSLATAFEAAATTLRDTQRDDGHWNWAILHREDRFDSSTTALVGYSITRGIQNGILSESFVPVARKALGALIDATDPDGVVSGSLAECRGLGKYPQEYRQAPWTQGATAAFAGVFSGEFGWETNGALGAGEEL